MFENYSKCRISIFGILAFSIISLIYFLLIPCNFFTSVDIATDLARFPNRGFKGLFLMAESHGQRGYGYFVPLLDSKAYLTPFNCENLPECEDKAECQGTANAIVHTNNEVKTNVSALWFAPSSMSGKEVTFVATVVERNDAKGSIWFEELESLSVFV